MSQASSLSCSGNTQRHLSRRDLLLQAGAGISGLALADLLGREGLLAASLVVNLR